MKPTILLLVLMWLVCQGAGNEKLSADDKLAMTKTRKTAPSFQVSAVSDHGMPNIRQPIKRRSKRNFVEWKWDSPNIPYAFDGKLEPAVKGFFFDAFREIERKTCIRFRPRKNEPDYVYIAEVDFGGCFSYIGKTGDGANPLNIGPKCDYKKEALHFLVHLLGMNDEHLRPDRDRFIKVFTFALKSHDAVAAQKKKYGNLVDEPYDYRSVMHHANNYLTQDKTKPIIMKLMPGGPVIGQRKALSDLDARKINKFYGCRLRPKPKPPPKEKNVELVSEPKPPPKEKNVELVSGHCNFDHGLCNWKDWEIGQDDNEDQFDWYDRTEAGGFAGPKQDYSENKPHGKFLFFPKATFEVEKMSSGVLASGFVRGPHCLTFRYFMPNGGRLRIFIKQAYSTEENPYEMIVERFGRRPNPMEWHILRKQIPGQPNPYQILIEGLKTGDQQYAVGVDDVFVYPGLTCNECPGSHVTYDGQCCKFPFQYEGKMYDRCIKSPGREFGGLYWCSTTSNYDQDKKGRRCTDLNECYKNPCASGATCVDLYFDYKCLCPEYVTGKNCDVDIDECVANPCSHGTCQNHVFGYTCMCTSGFTGKNCEKDINECETGQHDCGKTGKCVNIPGSYKCVCDSGYTGSNCLKDIDECLDNPCHHGNCINFIGGYSCKCKSGYTGKNCESDTDDCEFNPCKNKGNCTDLINRFECTCPKEFTGKLCEIDINECLANPCVHGSCANFFGGYSCKCEKGYTGKNCESDIDECVTSQHECSGQGICENIPGSYKCICVPGFTGPKCRQDIDECQSSPCQNSGVCIDLWNNFTCTCPIGFSGQTCEVPVALSSYSTQNSAKPFGVEQALRPWAFYGAFRKFVRFKGESLTIDCSNNDPWELPLLWHKHQTLPRYEIVPDGKRIRQHGHIFTVRNLTSRDSGLYTCYAAKGDGTVITEDMVTVSIVTTKPKTVMTTQVNVTDEDVTKLKGSKPYIYFDKKSPLFVPINDKKPCTLTAKIKGLQPMKISWLKDKVHLVTVNKIKTFNNGRMLVIEPPFSESDSGTYSAMACNSQGCHVRGMQVLFHVPNNQDQAEFVKEREDMEREKLFKKIGMIGGSFLLVIFIVGLVIFVSKKKRKPKSSEERAHSVWSWHSADSDHVEMPDYDTVQNYHRPLNHSNIYEAYHTIADEENIDHHGHMSPVLSHASNTSEPFEGTYETFGSHLLSGIYGHIAHIRQQPMGTHHGFAHGSHYHVHTDHVYDYHRNIGHVHPNQAQATGPSVVIEVDDDDVDDFYLAQDR